MSSGALLTADLGKIAKNTRTIVDALGHRRIVGVTSLACGSPEIARAMLSGGVVALGEYRLENIERMRAAQISDRIWLMRPPVPSLAADVVRLADVSVESELETVEALERAASAQGTLHDVIAMIDLGVFAPGLKPTDASRFLDSIDSLQHIVPTGFAASPLDGDTAATLGQLDVLIDLARQAETRLGRSMDVMAGGDAACVGMVPLDLVSSATVVIVHEAILLGCRTPESTGMDLDDDAIILTAPVVECRGRAVCSDAQGRRNKANQTALEDPSRERTVVTCDVELPGLQAGDLLPLDAGAKVVRTSDSRLLVDVHDMTNPPSLGATLAFKPNSYGMLQLFASPYVKRAYEPQA